MGPAAAGGRAPAPTGGANLSGWEQGARGTYGGGASTARRDPWAAWNSERAEHVAGIDKSSRNIYRQLTHEQQRSITPPADTAALRWPLRSGLAGSAQEVIERGQRDFAIGACIPLRLHR